MKVAVWLGLEIPSLVTQLMMNCGTAKCGDVDKMRMQYSAAQCSVVLCDNDGVVERRGKCGGGEGIQLSSRNGVSSEAAVAIAQSQLQSLL